jgi:hypothetical protein
MTIYENSSIYIENDGFIKTLSGKLAQFTIDTDNKDNIEDLQNIANNNNKPVYLIREFVAVDSNYQDHHPKKSAKDWYILKINPNL